MLPFFFYTFAIILVVSSIMVIVTKNPVHSVFFLILAFFNATGLFVLMGAEFLAMLLLVVYVGAVAVLFLFVVMMLNVAEQKQSWFRGLKSTHIPVGLIVGIIILLEILVVVGGWRYKADFISTNSIVVDSNFSNTHQLGSVLYTDYIYLFQIAGIILLLSMVGAIVLTYRKREGVKRQSYINQISRESKTSVEVVEVGFNTGVKIDD